MKHFSLIIRTPDHEVLDSKVVEALHVATVTGPMVIYAKHASLTGAILFSRLIVKTKDREDVFLARRGTLFVDNSKNRVVVLVFSCDPIETITYEQAEEYLMHIENLIQSGESIGAVKLKYLEREKLAIQEQVKALKEG